MMIQIYHLKTIHLTLTLPKLTAVVIKTNQEEGSASVLLGFATNVPTTANVEYQAG